VEKLLTEIKKMKKFNKNIFNISEIKLTVYDVLFQSSSTSCTSLDEKISEFQNYFDFFMKILIFVL
jgi:hypothetical protein